MITIITTNTITTLENRMGVVAETTPYFLPKLHYKSPIKLVVKHKSGLSFVQDFHQNLTNIEARN